MSAVSEWVVREYFETCGFLVQQPCKYENSGRRKREPGEDIDLLVVHPARAVHALPDRIVWTTDDLRHVARAVVGIRGWHTERFYVSTIEQTPDILRFVEPKALLFAGQQLGPGPLAKILCLPRLPASGELKADTIRVLREKGVDGVISFATILIELIRSVSVNRNYAKSDLLQVVRLLKTYDLIKDVQLDLFGRRIRHEVAPVEPGDA
ncbi:MAG: hypothetical protein A2498_07820 [Lentisphaerae bacterium RIFOXYC12_FULL_60_16]|nr:MAG: hypothetical protein A2498_07820 [Lentisphaerae bacterium RIFOXYC12_FULL_60_16]OGV86240.1 MAG: hypothetical protein A2340_13750 [Lentisphaerae bacterium RIFOXYB12_FULL_60_10]